MDDLTGGRRGLEQVLTLMPYYGTYATTLRGTTPIQTVGCLSLLTCLRVALSLWTQTRVESWWMTANTKEPVIVVSFKA
mgnify:FL=1